MYKIVTKTATKQMMEGTAYIPQSWETVSCSFCESSYRTPDHLFEPTVASMLKFLAVNGFEVLLNKTYSRRKMVDESAYRRWFHQNLYWGSNLRFYVNLKR